MVYSSSFRSQGALSSKDLKEPSLHMERKESKSTVLFPSFTAMAHKKMHSFISISHEAASYSFTVLFLKMCSAAFDTLERLGESKERRRKTWSCEQRTNKWCAVAETAKVSRQKYSLIGKAKKGRNVTFFSILLLASSYGYGVSHLLHH